MPSPKALPIRVLVKGASTASWTSWMGGPRCDLAFPRATEAALLKRGRPAEVRNAALMGTPTSELIRGWEQEVLQWSPDVVVIIAGHYETIHLFLPHWFERHANRADRKPGRLRSFYFRRIIRLLWKVLAEAQSSCDGPLGAKILRPRLKRVAVDLKGYLDVIQQVASPLVIVLELLPPTGSKGEWFPGMCDRITFMNQQLRDLTDRYDRSDVRFLEVRDLAHRLVGDDLAVATPDGFHYSPALHREVGAELAKSIDEWAQCQPHLTTGTDPSAASHPTTRTPAESSAPTNR